MVAVCFLLLAPGWCSEEAAGRRAVPTHVTEGGQRHLGLTPRVTERHQRVGETPHSVSQRQGGVLGGPGGGHVNTTHLQQGVNHLRDWSLFMGGGLQTGKIAGPKLKKGYNFLRPPLNMAKTSSYCIKTAPKHFVPPPLQLG